MPEEYQGIPGAPPLSRADRLLMTILDLGRAVEARRAPRPPEPALPPADVVAPMGDVDLPPDRPPPPSSMVALRQKCRPA